MTDPHPAHDRFLVAALASGDLGGDERDRADALLAGCADCAQLASDLRSIAAATARLPVPPRSRDFRLTAERAARLRPAGWRRLLAAFAGPRLAFTRPLATGLTTLGIVGLLLAALPGFAGGPAGGAGAVEQPAPALGSEAPAGALEKAPSDAKAYLRASIGASPAPEAAPPGDGALPVAPTAPPSGPPALGIASLLLLATGFGLFALRLAARRLVRA